MTTQPRQTDVARLTAAARALAAIESPQDAVGVVRYAELARVFARQAELGTEAENAATAIRLKAEIRLAETVSNGQEQGQIAAAGRPGNPPTGGGLPKATLRDLGVSDRRLSEARAIAAAMGAAQIDSLVDHANEQGQTLSRSAVLREVKASTGARTKARVRAVEEAMFTPAELARRRLEGVVSLELLPAAQKVAADSDYLTDQERAVIEGVIRTLTGSVAHKGLRVVNGTR